MAILRNKRKLAALDNENCEEHPRRNLAQHSIAPRSQEDYNTQFFDNIMRRVLERLSQEFSRTESHILGAPSCLDDFLLNSLIQGHSGAAPETSRNPYSTNQGTLEDESQSGPHREANISRSQMRNCGLEDDIVTGFYVEVPYCSFIKSSGKQEKNRSTSQAQSCRENTPAIIEADHFWLARQQLANNSASFHNNINRISKLPQSLSTTTPTFDWKSEKFGLFEDLLQTSLKKDNQLTQDDRIHYFHSLM